MWSQVNLCLNPRTSWFRALYKISRSPRGTFIADNPVGISCTSLSVTSSLPFKEIRIILTLTLLFQTISLLPTWSQLINLHALRVHVLVYQTPVISCFPILRIHTEDSIATSLTQQKSVPTWKNWLATVGVAMYSYFGSKRGRKREFTKKRKWSILRLLALYVPFFFS